MKQVKKHSKMNWWVESTKTFETLNYIEHFHILTSAVTGCISISAFSLLVILIGITSSALGLKICAIAAGIKKYNSITKKKKKKRDKVVLLGKSKLNSREVLISKDLIDSNLSHDEFILINNILKEYDYMKEDIKILKTWTVNRIF